MKYTTHVAVMIAGLLALTSVDAVAQGNPGKGQSAGPTPTQGQAQVQGQGQGQGQGQQTQQQKRQMERSTSQDAVTEHERLQQRERDRTQKQTSSVKSAGAAATAGGIYGGNLMTEQERNEYRERLHSMNTEQERDAFTAQHRQQMQQRSKERNVPIEVTDD